MSAAVILGYVMSFLIGAVAVAVAVLVGAGAAVVSLAILRASWRRFRVKP